MKMPNFFIIGAPKCGTTSLAKWLGKHPNIYVSPEKEPHYYSADFPIETPLTAESYAGLFGRAEPNHLAVGEASVWYLRSEVAVPNIQKEKSRARYIVMVRNPVEMAPSLHWQAVFSGDEDILDFEKAWLLQSEREKCQNFPKHCRDPKLVQYRLACNLGAQLKRLYSRVDKEQVLVLFLEDINFDPMREWEKTLVFLGVPFWADLAFSPENQSKRLRFRGIHTLRRGYLYLQQKIGVEPLGLGIFSSLQKLSTKQSQRKPLSPGLRQELMDTFRTDIQLLGELTGRDLSHWTSD